MCWISDKIAPAPTWTLAKSLENYFAGWETSGEPLQTITDEELGLLLPELTATQDIGCQTPYQLRAQYVPSRVYLFVLPLLSLLFPLTMAELIRLDRPPADFCVSVSGLAPALEVSKLTSYLREMGGPLWSLVVHEGAGARRWAMAFFYCESDCERCRHQCDGLVLAGMRLSTQRLTKLRGVDHPAAGREGIPAFKAIDLMNHYVGFNRWSSALLHLGPATDADDATIPTDTFLARMRVVVDGGLEVTAEGIGGGDGSRPHAESSAA